MRLIAYQGCVNIDRRTITTTLNAHRASEPGDLKTSSLPVLMGHQVFLKPSILSTQKLRLRLRLRFSYALFTMFVTR